MIKKVGVYLDGKDYKFFCNTGAEVKTKDYSQIENKSLESIFSYAFAGRIEIVKVFVAGVI